VGGVSAQKDTVTSAIDGLAKLGTVLNSNSGAALTLLDDLSAIAKVVDANRDKFVATADRLARFAESANAVVGPNAERIRTLLTHLDAVLATVVRHRATLERLIVDQQVFVEKFPMTVRNGQLLAYAWFLGPEANASRPDVFSLLAPSGATP
jgi:ABC-type transporter Mla subunit MlaD